MKNQTESVVNMKTVDAPTSRLLCENQLEYVVNLKKTVNTTPPRLLCESQSESAGNMKTVGIATS